MTVKKVITKKFLAKKPSGEFEEITVRYDRTKLVKPIFLLRSD